MRLRRLLIEETALQIRHHAAMRVVASLPPDERDLLLSYVIWPNLEMREATAERAREELLELHGEGQWKKAG